MTTTVYSDGNGNIVVNGVTMTAQQYMAQYGGANSGSATQPDQATIDGKQLLQSVLTAYGLTGLDMNAAWQAYVNSGDNIDYLTNTWLPTQPAFQAAFPAWSTWSKQGHNVAQYVDYQNTVYAEAHAAGFPQGVVDKDTITQFIENGVSAGEAQQRILDAGKAVYQLDKNSQDYLKLHEAGFTDGDIAAVWFDPNKALPVLENQLAAAQIGGAANRAGIDLNTNTADQLAKLGVSANQAQQGFNTVANSQQLFAPLPGQQGQAMSQDQQVAGTFGTDAAAAQQIANTQAQRKAVFQTGGTFTSTSQGFTGAGAARGA